MRRPLVDRRYLVYNSTPTTKGLNLSVGDRLMKLKKTKKELQAEKDALKGMIYEHIDSQVKKHSCLREIVWESQKPAQFWVKCHEQTVSFCNGHNKLGKKVKQMDYLTDMAIRLNKADWKGFINRYYSNVSSAAERLGVTFDYRLSKYVSIIPGNVPQSSRKKRSAYERIMSMLRAAGEHGEITLAQYEDMHDYCEACIADLSATQKVRKARAQRQLEAGGHA